MSLVAVAESEDSAAGAWSDADWLNDLAIASAVAAAGVVGHLALRKAKRRKKDLAGQIQAELWAEYGKSPVAWDEFHG